MKKLLLMKIFILLLGCDYESDDSLRGIIMWNQLELFKEHITLRNDNYFLKNNDDKVILEIDSLYFFIDSIKEKLLKLECPSCRDVFDAKASVLNSTSPGYDLLIGGNKNGLAYDLNHRMKKLKSELYVVVEGNDNLRNSIYFYLATPDPPKHRTNEILTWETNTFGGISLISIFNYLNLRQIYLLMLKSEITEYLNAG